MKNFNKLIPQSLSVLIDESNFSEATERILREGQMVSDDKNINHYERNQRFGHLDFQRAVIAFAQNQPNEAFEFAKKSFRYDAFTFPYHQALIELALSTKTEEAQLFASEVAWWFLAAHEYLNSTCPIDFWSKEDQNYANKNGLSLVEDANAVNATLEKYNNLPIIKQRLLESELFFARIELDDPNEMMTLIDVYEKKGLEKLRVDQHRTTVLFNTKGYDKIIALWGDYDISKITDGWAYLRLMISRIYQGMGLPDTLVLPDMHLVNDGYDRLTTFMTHLEKACDNIKNKDEASEQQLRECDELKRLLLWLGENVKSLYHEVEQGELTNGYANDAHFYAMFCRNFATVYEYSEDKNQALTLCEKGFSLSPFIENGRGMVNYALNLKEYERAERNIHTVRNTLDGYLDFYSHFHLDARYLQTQAVKGVVTYFDALKVFKVRYADFLHAMRINSLTDADLRPSAVVEWTSTHNVYIGNVEGAVALLYARHPDDSEVLAHYFEVQALTANRKQVDWCKEFALNLKYILSDKSHPNFKENCFKALAGYGYLKLKEAMYAKDSEIYSEGLEKLECAVAIKAADPRERADAYVKMGRTACVKLEDYASADKYLTEAIDLLEEYGIQPDTLEFIGDPLLSYAYHFRGTARDKLPKKRPEDTIISDDFVKFCAINDSKNAHLSAYEVAYFSTLEESRVDEQYQHAMQYIDAIEKIEPDFEARGSVMGTTVINLLEYGDKERAETLLEALKKDFPEHEDLSNIEYILKKMDRRKGILGFFDRLF